MTAYHALTVWALVFAIGVPTFLLRYSFIGLFGRFEAIPAWIERALAFVPAAVFAALVVPDIVVLQPTPLATLGQDRLLAGAVAAVVAYRTENVLATVVAGMVALWVLRFALPPGL